MKKSILIGIAFAITSLALPASAEAISYTTSQPYQKTAFKGQVKYTEYTVTCDIKAKNKKRTVSLAGVGFGRTGYYANEVPFISAGYGNFMHKDGYLWTFDAAAQKACGGK